MKKHIKMYENNKNQVNTSLKDLETFLQLIADLDKEVEFFAMGGTAMVLKNIKEAIELYLDTEISDIKGNGKVMNIKI